MPLTAKEERMLIKWKKSKKFYATSFYVGAIFVIIIIGGVRLFKGIVDMQDFYILTGLFTILLGTVGLIPFVQVSRLYSIMEKLAAKAGDESKMKLSDKEERIIAKWGKSKEQRYFAYILLNLAIIVSIAYFTKGLLTKNNYAILGGYLVFLLSLVSIISLWKFLQLYAIIERIKKENKVDK